MKTLLIAAASLILLSGCAGMELTSVSVGTTYSTHHSSYAHHSLGYYSGSHFHGYTVYGAHGHRYYRAPSHYAPRYYNYSPRVVVVHPRVIRHHPRAHPRQNHRNRNDRRHDRRHEDRNDRRHKNRNRNDRRDRNRDRRHPKK